MTGSEEIKKDFEQYLDKYCSTYKVTREEALGHAVVVEVGKHYGVNDQLINALLYSNG